jgi:hypothetical protein
LVERNKDLNEEIDFLTLENQKINLKVNNLQKEFELLMDKYKELDKLYR